MSYGTAQFTRLENPADSCKDFCQDYLKMFLERFKGSYGRFTSPVEHDNAQYIALNVVAAADRINYAKERPLFLIWPCERRVLCMEGIYPGTIFERDLGWDKALMRVLANRINKYSRQRFPSLLDPGELRYEQDQRLMRRDFTVEDCIDHCIEKSARLSVSPDDRVHVRC